MSKKKRRRRRKNKDKEVDDGNAEPQQLSVSLAQLLPLQRLQQQLQQWCHHLERWWL
jgi:hypothetical protein